MRISPRQYLLRISPHQSKRKWVAYNKINFLCHYLQELQEKKLLQVVRFLWFICQMGENLCGIIK